MERLTVTNGGGVSLTKRVATWAERLRPWGEESFQSLPAAKYASYAISTGGLRVPEVPRTRLVFDADKLRPASREDAPAAESLRRRFVALAEEWRSATGPLSSPSASAMHPAYQQIIGMGTEAVPLLLQCLVDCPEDWFWALKAITGEDPVREEERGSLAAMTEAWLMWGRRRGLLR